MMKRYQPIYEVSDDGFEWRAVTAKQFLEDNSPYYRVFGRMVRYCTVRVGKRELNCRRIHCGECGRHTEVKLWGLVPPLECQCAANFYAKS